MRLLALALVLFSMIAAAPALACDPDDDPEDCVRPSPRASRQLPPAPPQRRMEAPPRRMDVPPRRVEAPPRRVEAPKSPSRAEAPKTSAELSPPTGGEGKPVSEERTAERKPVERKSVERTAEKAERAERKSICRQYSPTIGRTIEVSCD